MEFLGRSRFALRDLADGFEMKGVTPVSRVLVDRLIEFLDVRDGRRQTRPKRMGIIRDLADRRQCRGRRVVLKNAVRDLAYERRVTIADVTERRCRVLQLLLLPSYIYQSNSRCST